MNIIGAAKRFHNNHYNVYDLLRMNNVSHAVQLIDSFYDSNERIKISCSFSYQLRPFRVYEMQGFLSEKWF